MTVLFLLVACAEDAPGGSGGADARPVPSLDLVCSEDPGGFSDLAAAPTEVATVLRVGFSTLYEGPAWVAYADSKVQRGIDARDGEALLLGMGASERVAWRAVVDTDRGPVCSALQVSETGLLPADVPELTVDGEADGGGGYVLAPILTEDDVTAVLIDPLGRVVWAQRIAEGPHLGPYRVRPTRDGLGIVAALSAPEMNVPAQVVSFDWAGVRYDGPVLFSGHTDMTQLDDGTYAMLGWQIREVSPGRRMLGDTIVEVSPRGVQRVVWSAFDAIVPLTDEYYTNTFYTADPSVEDWTHASGLSYDVQDDDYLVTLRNLSLVVRVDRESGRTVWMAGGGRLGVPPGSVIEGPHSVERLREDRYLVFNNGVPGEGCSRAVEVRVDPQTHAVEQRHTYGLDACHGVAFLGNADVQDDGSVRVAWSSEGRLETFTAEGESRQGLDVPVGHAFGFVEPVTFGRR